MNAKDAKKLAKEAIEVADEEGEPVADTTVVFKNANGTFCVLDNGESIDGLDKRNAIRIIVENLTANSDKN